VICAVFVLEYVGVNVAVLVLVKVFDGDGQYN
jgi:hypothetical protein